MSTLFEPVLDNLLIVAQCGVYFFDTEGNLAYKRVPRGCQDAHLACTKLLNETYAYLKQSSNILPLSKSSQLGGCSLPDHSVVIVGPVENRTEQRLLNINAMLSNIMWFAQRSIPKASKLADTDFGRSYIDELMEIKHLLPDWSEVIMEDASHHSYADELLPLDAVTQGDVAAYIRYKNHPDSREGRDGTLGDTPLRHHQNLALCSIVLSSRAAIVGGLSVEQAYTMADFLILAVERCTSIHEADVIAYKAGVIFARMVHDLQIASPKSSGHSHSYMLIRILDLIKRSIYKKVSRKEFAAQLHVSQETVDRLLKQELNQTLIGCLREARLKEAANLLTQSDASVFEIASMLNFTHSSHFCRSFKAFYGMTPNDYRLLFYKKFGNVHPQHSRDK